MAAEGVWMSASAMTRQFETDEKRVSRYQSGAVAEKTPLQAVHISLSTRLATGKERVIKVVAG
jgi:hypothetical protein